MLGSLIEQARENMTPEVKAALGRVDEFLPIIKSYNEAIPMQEGKNEIGVAYVLRFEDAEGGKVKIMLYQIMLAAKEGVNGGKPTFSRSLGSWDVTEKLNEIKG